MPLLRHHRVWLFFALLLLPWSSLPVPVGQCDSPALQPFPAWPLCDQRCPSPVGYFWSPVTTKRATVHYSHRTGRVEVNNTSACGALAEAVQYAFLLEDAPSLGHMQMSFTALFSFLLGLPPKAAIIVVWQALAEEFKRVKALYYVPLLAHLRTFFHAESQLSMRDVHAEDLKAAGSCFSGEVIGMRTCTVDQLPHGGHCAAWFSGPPAVAAFRKFLRQQLNLSLVYDGCCSRRRTSWSVLLFDRARGRPRRLKSPRVVRNAIEAFFSHQSASLPMQVDYYQHTAGREGASRFEDNCAKWSSYDLIIAVHGAALSNLVCARPCAMVIEIGFLTPHLTMYTRLAAQLQLHHCFVPFAPGASWYDAVMPGNLTGCLQQFLELHHPLPS